MDFPLLQDDDTWAVCSSTGCVQLCPAPADHLPPRGGAPVQVVVWARDQQILQIENSRLFALDIHPYPI
jgi:hypothetical protein